MYVDLFLLLNLAVNFFLLRLTAFIARQNSDLSRLLLVSIGAALFPLFVYLTETPSLLSWPVRIVLPLIMVYISFRPRQYRQIICQYLIFYLCSLALGGLALAFNIREGSVFSGGEFYIISPPSLVTLFFAAVLVYTGVRLAEPVLLGKIYFHLPPAAPEIEISFCGKSKKLAAFLDTGNMLRCPFSGIPVAVAAYPWVKELLPGDICSFLEDRKKMDWFRLEKILSKTEDAAKFCIVPYRSLQEKGFLLAFRPEKVKLWERGSGTALETKLIVAVQQIGSETDYEVLLPTEAWCNAVPEKRERNAESNNEKFIFLDNKV